MDSRNKTDMSAYEKFMKAQDLQYGEVTSELKDDRLSRNLSRWKDHHVPSDLRGANLSLFVGAPANYFAKYDKEGGRIESIQIISDSKRVGKVYLYSILEGIIRRGIAAPNEVVMTDFQEGVRNIHGMFEAKEWKKKVFNRANKVIVIEGGSSPLIKSLELVKGYEQFIKELVDFAAQNKITLLSTYTITKKDTEAVLSKEDTVNRKMELVKVSQVMHGKGTFIGKKVPVFSNLHIKKK